MKHNRKVLQEIIDRVDPHDKLRNDAMAIKIAELYAEWAVKNCSIPAVINRRELLIDFLMATDEVYAMHIRENAEKCADEYLKSINSL